MTDYRNDILNSIQMVLIDNVPDESVRITVDWLITILNDYEIGQRCTALSIIDSTSEKYLKMFLATKKVEGRSDWSIKRYWYEVTRFMYFVGVSVTDITHFMVT